MSDGVGIISIYEKYWVYRNGKFLGPYTAIRGEITASMIVGDMWAYGTNTGDFVIEKIQVK